MKNLETFSQKTMCTRSSTRCCYEGSDKQVTVYEGGKNAEKNINVISFITTKL